MIQHVTQNNNGIANDCAPACFVMAVNAHRGTEYTIPQVDQDIQNVPNEVTSVARLINAFRSYKVPALDAEYRDPHWCKSMLNAGHILIPLTKRSTTGYIGNHYILLHGRVEFGLVSVWDPMQDTGPLPWSFDEIMSWVVNGNVIALADPLFPSVKQEIIRLVMQL